MRKNTFIFWVLILVDGVFGVDTDGVMSVSVMEGDSVTLYTDLTEIQRDNKIIWKFDKEIIAKIHEAEKIFNTYDGHDGRFRDRLKLDEQNGSLTITNIRTEHAGVYSVDIKSTDAKLKTFNVTVHDEVKTVSMKKGDQFILRTGVLDIQEYDQISWKFSNGLIGEIKKGANRFSLFSAGRFEGRLQPNEKTGSLTISESRITDSGDYQLHMISSTHTIQRNISVTITDSRNSGAVSGICGATVGLVVWAVTVFLLQEV